MTNQPVHDITPGETVMWEEDYERLKKQQKMDAAIERSNKEKADALAREQFKENQKIKDRINYTEDLATEICERISAGELLINICRDTHMPTVRRCSAWLKSEADFQALYNIAIADRLTIFEEEVISIADDAARDMKEIMKAGKKIMVQDAEVIARAKLRVEVRFRHLKAGRPQKWGDSTTLITKSEDENIAEMPLSELEKKIAELEHKDRVVKAV
jgi:hypothetical protein